MFPNMFWFRSGWNSPKTFAVRFKNGFRKIPSWVEIKIAPQAKYLGFFLGPGSADASWDAPVAKFLDRVEAIASSGVGPAVSAFTYNTKTVPTLGFVLQLAFLPSKVWEIERTKLHRLFHLPNTLITAFFMNWAELGLPAVVSLKALNIVR